MDQPGQLIGPASDEFNSPAFTAQWTWIRPPSPGTSALTGSSFEFQTQSAELYVDTNTASVLTEPAPSGDYIVETRLNLNLPVTGCCQNFVQAGLVIYGHDDNYIKLVHVSIFDTRQTELAKELPPVPSYPRYGSTSRVLLRIGRGFASQSTPSPPEKLTAPTPAPMGRRGSEEELGRTPWAAAPRSDWSQWAVRGSPPFSITFGCTLSHRRQFEGPARS